MRVDRLGKHRATRGEFASRQSEEGGQRLIRKVFDHLYRDNGAERSFRDGFKRRYRIAEFDVQSLLATALDHAGIEVDAARFDSGFAEQFQELAAAATHVEDRRMLSQERQVGL